MKDDIKKLIDNGKVGTAYITNFLLDNKLGQYYHSASKEALIKLLNDIKKNGFDK